MRYIQAGLISIVLISPTNVVQLQNAILNLFGNIINSILNLKPIDYEQRAVDLPLGAFCRSPIHRTAGPLSKW